MVGDDARGEPELVRLIRCDGVTDQTQLQRLGRPHQPRQPLRAAEPGDDSEVDLRLTEERRLRRDPEIARHRQLAAAPDGERVDRRDRDHARALHTHQQLMHTVD